MPPAPARSPSSRRKRASCCEYPESDAQKTHERVNSWLSKWGDGREHLLLAPPEDGVLPNEIPVVANSATPVTSLSTAPGASSQLVVEALHNCGGAFLARH